MPEDIKEPSINLREYSRVEVVIPLQIRLVPPGEQEYFRSCLLPEMILAEFTTLPDVEDKQLADWLRMLNNKLDAIINALSFHNEGIAAAPLASITISANGMGFYSNRQYLPDDLLELKMMLPLIEPVGMCLYGRVVRVVEVEHSFEVAVIFVAMDEHIRELIARLVFEKEREIIRGKKR